MFAAPTPRDERFQPSRRARDRPEASIAKALTRAPGVTDRAVYRCNRGMAATQEQPALVSVREAAQLAGVSYATIWRLIQRGEVPAIRVGNETGPLRIPREEFRRWLYAEPNKEGEEA